MSDKTDALYNTLQVDLQDHLDDYQFRSSRAGKFFWPDVACKKQVACASLVSKIFSKLTVCGEVTDVARQAALDKFIACNERCGEFSFSLNDSADELFVGTLKDVLREFFYPNGEPILSSLGELISRGGVGPGASVSARGDDLYTKIFDSSLSYTKEDLLTSWEWTVSQDDRWFAALFDSYRAGRVPRTVEGSSLSFVSKNEQVARGICTEPTINMWVQLGIGDVITERLKSYFGIDLSSQQGINKDMAWLASLGAEFCTIDLESASDSISNRLLAEILPPAVYTWLGFARSPTTRLPDGTSVSLNMVSTMGNGFTFPLQTAVFAACLKSVYETLNEPFIKTRARSGEPASVRYPDVESTPRWDNDIQATGAYGTFAVFGDDIICTKRTYRSVVRLLNLCGFKVNAAKSFSQGLFYESCGGDYWNGTYVRPFYVKSLDTTQDLYKAINGLNRWSALHDVPLHNTVQLLFGWLGKVRYVPMHEADDAGLHVPLALVRERGNTLKEVGLREVYPGTIAYSASVPRKCYLLIQEDVIASGKDQRTRRYNPSGLWLSFLFGCVRGYRISLRQRTVRYTSKRKVTPCWDTLSPLHRSLGIDGRRLASATSQNLIGF